MQVAGSAQTLKMEDQIFYGVTEKAGDKHFTSAHIKD